MEPSPVSCLSVIETECLLNRSIIGAFHQVPVSIFQLISMSLSSVSTIVKTPLFSGTR